MKTTFEDCRFFGETVAMLTSQVWNRVYPYMREPDCTQLAAEIRDAAYEFEKEWNDTPEEKRDGYYIDMIDEFANRLTAKLRDLLCDVPTPCSNIRVIKAVANEIENMMYNDINEGNGIEGFEGWCAGGEVFEESGLDVEECMQLVREVAPLVDELVYKHLNVDQVEIDKTRKIYAIEDAARFNKFTDEIDEIDMLSYTEQDESGEERIVEDRFDYIDTTTIPISVHFICGTGHPNRNIPIGFLTEESINKLYACIRK